MLAPRIAKPKAKTTAISNTESPLQRSAGRRSGDRANGQSPIRAASASMNEEERRHRDEPNFGSIPVHAPERTGGLQMKQAGTAQVDTSKAPPIVNPPQGQPEKAPRSPAQRPKRERARGRDQLLSAPMNR